MNYNSVITKKGNILKYMYNLQTVNSIYTKLEYTLYLKSRCSKNLLLSVTLSINVKIIFLPNYTFDNMVKLIHYSP